MALNHKNMLTRFYAALLTRIAPFYKLIYKTLLKVPDRGRPKRVVKDEEEPDKSIKKRKLY